MKLGIVLELVLLAAGLGRGDDRPAFAVENRCPPAFVVVDRTAAFKCPNSKEGRCACKSGECADARCECYPAGPGGLSWYAAPFGTKHKKPRHPTPPGYPPAAPGFHWAKFPGDVWGLVQDGLAPPKGYAAAPPPVQACPTGTCPLNRR